MGILQDPHPEAKLLRIQDHRASIAGILASAIEIHDRQDWRIEMTFLLLVTWVMQYVPTSLVLVVPGGGG